MFKAKSLEDEHSLPASYNCKPEFEIADFECYLPHREHSSVDSGGGLTIAIRASYTRLVSLDQRYLLIFVIVREVEKLGIERLFDPLLLVRGARVIKLILNQLPACDFIEDAAVRLVFVRIEAGQQFFDHAFFLNLRHFV